MRIAAGRMFTPSASEAVVGSGVVGRYRRRRARQRARVRARDAGRWSAFSTPDGSSFESEVWVDVRELANDAKRAFPYSGVRLRVADGADMAALERRIDDDPRYALEAQRETDYYAKQSESANTLYVLVIGIAVLAGIGAGFGASNTMYAAVQARTAEIGTLRALGFSRGSILWSFQIEAVALSGARLRSSARVLRRGCSSRLIGLCLGGIAFGAAHLHDQRDHPRVDAVRPRRRARARRLVIGLAGGLGPAWRAARTAADRGAAQGVSALLQSEAARSRNPASKLQTLPSLAVRWRLVRLRTCRVQWHGLDQGRSTRYVTKRSVR